MSTINKVIIDAGMRRANSAQIRRALKTTDLDFRAWQFDNGSNNIHLGIIEKGKQDFAIVLTYDSGFKSVEDSVEEIRTALANNESW